MSQEKKSNPNFRKEKYDNNPKEQDQAHNYQKSLVTQAHREKLNLATSQTFSPALSTCLNVLLFLTI